MMKLSKIKQETNKSNLENLKTNSEVSSKQKQYYFQPYNQMTYRDKVSYALAQKKKEEESSMEQ